MRNQSKEDFLAGNGTQTGQNSSPVDSPMEIEQMGLVCLTSWAASTSIHPPSCAPVANCIYSLPAGLELHRVW